MLDKKFFRELSIEVVAIFRGIIFDPAGGGSNAKDVWGNDYPEYTSNSYKKAKRERILPRRNARFSNSNAPVLTGDLMKDFQDVSNLSDTGFRFGTPTRGAIVKHLTELGREISSKKQVLPKKVESFIKENAEKYVMQKLKKQIKGRTFNI